MSSLAADLRSSRARHPKQRVARPGSSAVTLPGTGRRQHRDPLARRGAGLALRREPATLWRWPSCCPRRTPRPASRRTPAGRRACASVTRPWSTWTSSSTQVAPALRRSVRSDGHEVSVRPRTTPASISVHGPWQITATGLACVEERAHERDRVLVDAQEVGVGDAAGQHEPVVARGVGLGAVWSTGNVSALSRWLKRLHLAGLERDQLGACRRRPRPPSTDRSAPPARRPRWRGTRSSSLRACRPCRLLSVGSPLEVSRRPGGGKPRPGGAVCVRGQPGVAARAMEYVIPIVLVVLLVGGFVDVHGAQRAPSKSGPVATPRTRRASAATRRRSATRRSTRASERRRRRPRTRSRHGRPLSRTRTPADAPSRVPARARARSARVHRRAAAAASERLAEP